MCERLVVGRPLTPIEDEPRVLDTDLAERLGIARSTNIRQLIEQNREELEDFGHVARAECNVPMPQGGYKTATAYYLNEEQALLICALSRTEKAKAVRATIIRVFMAWRRGELVDASTTSLVPVVHVKDGQVFANSRDVAEVFGKRHDNVLRDISNLTLATPSDLRWFIDASYRDAKGEYRPAWDMTRDGFTLLVMGYTGPKAMAFKVAYITRFNEMEDELRNQQSQLPDFRGSLGLHRRPCGGRWRLLGGVVAGAPLAALSGPLWRFLLAPPYRRHLPQLLK